MAYTPEEVEWMRKAMGIIDEPEPMRTGAAQAPSVSDINEDYICLENIACVDADGNVTETHPKLCVKKDIERDGKGKFISVTPYKGITHFEQQGNGLFLPPFGLSCRVAVELFNERQSPEIEKVLKQYWDYVSGDGIGYGWHCQNTLINWARNVIINYPNDADFPSNGGSNNVNAGKRYELSFEREGLAAMDLEAALKGGAEMKRFARQFTMLEQPEQLVELGKYFRKPARLWIPDADYMDTNAAWLGCDDNYFYLDAYSSLDNNIAARGVSSS